MPDQEARRVLRALNAGVWSREPGRRNMRVWHRQGPFSQEVGIAVNERAQLVNGLLESLDEVSGGEGRKAAARQFRANVGTYLQEEFSSSWETADPDQIDEAMEAVSIVYCVIGKAST